MEERSLLPHIGPLERRTVDGFPIAFSRFHNVAICRTGIGERAGRAAAALFASRKPEAVLSLGFAGGVDPSLGTGDVFVCRELKLCRDGDAPPCTSSEDLMAMAQRAAGVTAMPVWTGVNGTVPAVLTGRDSKLAVAEPWGVQTVDMESYWVGRLAETAGIPFLGVRIVLDRLDDALPPTEGLVTVDGQTRPSGALKRLLRRPVELPSFLALARASEAAGSSLRRFAGEFITEWDSSQ